jgi:23S rRNA (uracil1939-C5)-methyltransferase
MSYEATLDAKRRHVQDCFERIGHLQVSVPPVLGMKDPRAYRNKTALPIGGTAAEPVLGFFAPRSHRVVSARTCSLQPRIFSELLFEIEAWIETYQISVYDEESQAGLLRHVYLRCSADAREILLTLVVNGKALPHTDELTERLRVFCEALVGVVLNVNEENTNVICGDEYRLLWGRDYIEDTLCGVKLQLRPAAFYQVNHDATELLYQKAAELADLRGDELLLDLFCGVGSIGLSMADRVQELVGIEIVPDAILCAKENAARNGITNAHFYVGDAADTERLLAGAESELGRRLAPDAVIVDPPRRGADEALLRFLAARDIPKIVYISCNPDTLARDAARLTANGYEMGAVTPADLFPCTGHVESIVCLTRRLDD